MGEPERRRRRVRPAAATTEPTGGGADDDTSTEPPADPPVTTKATILVEHTSVTADLAGTGPANADGAENHSTIADSGAAVESAAAAAEAGERAARGNSRANNGRRTGPGGDEREMERGLRGLVGSGSSQVSVGAALRARDAARPNDEQLAEADATVQIVRRNWLPREDLPRTR